MADPKGSSAGTFLNKIRDWKPRCCKKPLTGGSAPGRLHDNEQVERIPPASSTLQGNHLLQFGAVQHYNGYPGPASQQMSWAYGPQHGNVWASQGNVSTYPYPVEWNQHEEAVRTFAAGSYQGFHGVAVSLKPETFLKLSPEQQMGLINIGKTHDYHGRPPLLPKVSHFANPPVPERAVTVIEEPEPKPAQPASEEPAPEPAPEPSHPAPVDQPPKCMECNKQITINIMPHQCSAVPLCGPCYHGSVRRYAVYSSSHSC